MKRPTRRLLSALLAVCLALGLAAPSLALETTPITPLNPIMPIAEPYQDEITVYVNDIPVVFTDAVPQYSGYSYAMLPLRGVMEALGAEVGFDAAAGSVTAEYGGIRVDFGLGGDDATVTDIASGESFEYWIYPTPVNSNGRILVPSSIFSVFGLTVRTDYRAVMITDFDKALEGFDLGSYEILDSMMAYSAGLEGGYSQEGTYSGSIAMDYPDEELKLDLPFSGKISNLTSGADANGEISINLDFSKITSLPGMDEASLQTIKTLLSAFKDINVEYIIDGENGFAYIKSAVIAFLSGNLDGSESWYKLDLGGLAGAYSGLPAEDAAAEASFKELMKDIAVQSGASVPGESISTAKYMLALMEEIIFDKSFKKSGTDAEPSYTWVMNNDSLIDAMFAAAEKVPGVSGMPADKAAAKAELDEIGLVLDCGFTVTLGDGKYSEDVAMTMTVNDPSTGAVKMELKGSSSLPGKQTMDMSVSFDIEGMKLDVTFKYDIETKVTDKVPASAPPAGAVIVE